MFNRKKVFLPEEIIAERKKVVNFHIFVTLTVLNIDNLKLSELCWIFGSLELT